MQRREQMNLLKTDPYEELSEVYVDIVQMETDFKKALEIATAMIKNSREQHLHAQET